MAQSLVSLLEIGFPVQEEIGGIRRFTLLDDGVALVEILPLGGKGHDLQGNSFAVPEQRYLSQRFCVCPHTHVGQALLIRQPC